MLTTSKISMSQTYQCLLIIFCSKIRVSKECNPCHHLSVGFFNPFPYSRSLLTWVTATSLFGEDVDGKGIRRREYNFVFASPEMKENVAVQCLPRMTVWTDMDEAKEARFKTSIRKYYEVERCREAFLISLL